MSKISLKASGAYQWGNCSGSATAISRCRDDDRANDERDLGIATHELISTCLTNDIDPVSLIGLPLSNGRVVDEEMANCAVVMIDSVTPLLGLEHVVEQEIQMPQVFQGHRGFVDFAAYDRAEGKVYVYEYKNGRSPVDAYRNFQLIDYSIGLINFWGINIPVEFVFRVVQPRSYTATGPVRSWSVMSYELNDLYRQLHDKAHEAKGPNPTLTTGQHCRSCPAIGICGAARKASYNAIDLADDPLEVDIMDDTDIGIEYEMLKRASKMIEKRFQSLEDEIKYRIENGSSSTGYTMGRNAGKWVWKGDNEDVIDQIKTQFGVDAETRSVKTVAQIRNSLPAKVRRAFDVVRPMFAEKKEGSEKLIPISESKSFRVFGGKRDTA